MYICNGNNRYYCVTYQIIANHDVRYFFYGKINVWDLNRIHTYIMAWIFILSQIFTEIKVTLWKVFQRPLYRNYVLVDHKYVTYQFTINRHLLVAQCFLVFCNILIFQSQNTYTRVSFSARVYVFHCVKQLLFFYFSKRNIHVSKSLSAFTFVCVP